jgi:hypothetical protein
MLSDYGIAESVDYDYDYYERWKEAIVQIAVSPYGRVSPTRPLISGFSAG